MKNRQKSHQKSASRQSSVRPTVPSPLPLSPTPSSGPDNQALQLDFFYFLADLLLHQATNMKCSDQKHQEVVRVAFITSARILLTPKIGFTDRFRIKMDGQNTSAKLDVQVVPGEITLEIFGLSDPSSDHVHRFSTACPPDQLLGAVGLLALHDLLSNGVLIEIEILEN